MNLTEKVFKAIAKEYSVKPSDIKGKVRSKPFPECRRMFCHLMDGVEKDSWVKYMLNIDSVTLTYNRENITYEIDHYADTKRHYDNLHKKLLKLIENETEFKTERAGGTEFATH